MQAGLRDYVQLRPMPPGARWKVLGMAWIVDWSHALAFAADQHSRHSVRHIASLHQRSVRSMPARVIGVMTGGTAFALIALPAGSAVQHDLMRTGSPVFIDVKFRGFGCSRCWLRDEAGVGR